MDSHFGLPWVTYDLDTLMEVHVAPFAEAIDGGVDALTTAHMVVEAVDPDMPATLSRTCCTTTATASASSGGRVRPRPG